MSPSPPNKPTLPQPQQQQLSRSPRAPPKTLSLLLMMLRSAEDTGGAAAVVLNKCLLCGWWWHQHHPSSFCQKTRCYIRSRVSVRSGVGKPNKCLSAHHFKPVATHWPIIPQHLHRSGSASLSRPFVVVGQTNNGTRTEEVVGFAPFPRRHTEYLQLTSAQL